MRQDLELWKRIPDKVIIRTIFVIETHEMVEDVLDRLKSAGRTSPEQSFRILEDSGLDITDFIFDGG